MKIYILWLLPICLFQLSCDNELDLVADFQDIPIVYGVLCPADTAFYIRLERAFIDEQIAATEIAQDPNALYYSDATVELIQLTNSQRHSFQMVDGSLEGYPREEGLFASVPNYLYKLPLQQLALSEGEELLLQIQTGEDEETVGASTFILDPPLITRPSSSTRLDFDYVGDFTFKWNSDEQARFSDLVLTFRYDEINSSDANPIWKARSLNWNVASLLELDEFSQAGITFYQYIGAELAAGDQFERTFTGIDLSVHNAGLDLYEYIKAGQANLGLSSSLEVPKYTNLSKGLGIFASKSTSTRTGLRLTAKSLDSLQNGQFTRHLNFR